jgi:hypothetical protein
MPDEPINCGASQTYGAAGCRGASAAIRRGVRRSSQRCRLTWDSRLEFSRVMTRRGMRLLLVPPGAVRKIDPDEAGSAGAIGSAHVRCSPLH